MENENVNREELIEKFIAEIKAKENFSSFFNGYSLSSVESFVKIYATKKAVWTISGQGFKTEMERMEMLWENEAIKRLEEIQQVKLFLYQCNYRAGAIDEPTNDVRTIFDFIYWKDNVLNARFLEPVTKEDIELYCDYLMSPEVNHSPFIFIEDWQDFEAIREAYTSEEDTGRNVPEWYMYYFSRTGHGVELTMPDIKKEKNVYYFLEGNKERSRLFLEAEKKALDDNPSLAAEKGAFFNEYADNNLNAFMHAFEDNENRDMLKVWDNWTTFNEREDMMREDLDILMYAEEDVAVPENMSWIEATQIAAANYRSIKIAESLPAAYDQYKMNLDLDITFPERDNSRRNADFYNDLVLLGRKLLGEPEDFNY
ncbi:MAG: hypothetical protein ABJA90_07980 [Ginsengibacter sp.]